MGLLDDAIREHLDLKRRRGADPAEVERAEREALGPVRRYPEAPDAPVGHDEDAPLGYDHEEEEWPHDDDVRLPQAPMHDVYDEPPASAYREPDDALAPQDLPPSAAAASPTSAGQLGEETEEYDVEAEHHPHGSDEDVLEETPEFLQDTPDHDRLWFEQRPPRDFDFDG